MAADALVLRISCPDRQGIVAAVSHWLLRHGCNIVEARQFEDVARRHFFMRVVFVRENGDAVGLAELRAAFVAVAEPMAMEWSLRSQVQKRRVLIMVSKFDHCLVDLLYRKRIGELAMEVTGVVANHGPENYGHLDLDGAPFHFLPVTVATKAQQEAKLLSLVAETQTDLVVLARYMQVLSKDLAAKLSMRCINIHHSFLPGFKGAKPYHQAYTRGVKLMGATAHFVTGDLDEGPIIEQDVERISHADTPEDMIRKGRDVERRVLARAVHYYLEDRIFLNGSKTVIFPN